MQRPSNDGQLLQQELSICGNMAQHRSEQVLRLLGSAHHREAAPPAGGTHDTAKALWPAAEHWSLTLTQHETCWLPLRIVLSGCRNATDVQHLL
jgi:hypothetical protein